MDMVGTDMALENFDVLGPTNFANQIPHRSPDVPQQDRLAILRGKDEMVVQGVNGMGCTPELLHGRSSYRKPPEGFAWKARVSPIPGMDTKTTPQKGAASLRDTLTSCGLSWQNERLDQLPFAAHSHT